MTARVREKRVSAALLLLALAACKSSGSNQETDELPSIAGSFEVYETRRGDRSGARPSSTLVDYDSEITIRVDRALLARTLGIREGADSSLQKSAIDALDLEISGLERQLVIVDELEPVLRSIAAFEEASLRYFAGVATSGRVVQEDEAWRAFTSIELEAVESLKALTRIFVNYSSYDGEFDWEAEPDEEDSPEGKRIAKAQGEFEHVYGKMVLPTDAGMDRDLIDAAAVAALLNDTAELLADRIEEVERAVLAKAPKATLEMEAHLIRDKSLPVTISPYSIVEGIERGKKSPRVGLPSKEDIARVRAGYEAHAELADSINGLKDLVKDKERLDALKQSLLDTLETAAKSLTDRLEADLKEILAQQEDSLNDIRELARAVRDEVRSLARNVKDLREAAKDSDPVTLTEQALALVKQLKANTLKGKLDELVALLKTVPSDVSAAGKQLLLRVRSSLKSEFDQLVAALENTPGTGDISKLFSSLKKLHSLSNVQAFGDLKPTKITRKPFSIEVAQNGSVNLADTPAESGDELQIRYKIITDPESESGKTEHRASSLLDVRKFGAYSTFKSQILFYNRLSHGTSTFQAAPGICYNLHYRPESNQGFHDVVAPGLGLSVSSPGFEDGTELAIGLQLTLFNDLLQAGYAYNISVDDDPGMFYFGLDLIGAFQTL